MMASGGLIAAAGFAMAAGSGRSAGLHAIKFTLPLWGPVTLPLYRLVHAAGWGWGWRFFFWPHLRYSAVWRDWLACPSPGSARR